MNFNYNPRAFISHLSFFNFLVHAPHWVRVQPDFACEWTTFILHLSVDSGLVHLNNLFWNLGTHPEVMPKKASRCLELGNCY